MLRPNPPGDSGGMCLIVPELDFTMGPHVPLLWKSRRRALVTSSGEARCPGPQFKVPGCDY